MLGAKRDLVMKPKSILIIGAGIGGLATGCYARMNGYGVRILEMGGTPGGVCTAWKRHGYVFDGCIHNLAGSGASSPFHRMWQELGVLPARKMHAYDELVRVERPDGEPWTVYANLDRLEQHTKEIAPEDAAAIEELLKAARRCLDFDALSLAAASLGERIRTLQHLPMMLKWGRITLDQYARGLRSPFLRQALPTIVYDWPRQPMSILLTFLAGLHKGDLGWPIGGSAAFARAIETRFRGLGGEIHYETRVASILVKGDRAVGVRLADGSEQRADVIVSNANGYATIFEMLGGRYTTRAIRRYYRSPVDRIEMGVHVSLGLNRDLSNEPHAIVWPLERPVRIADETRERLYIEPFGFDPTLAPAGKAPLKVVFRTSYRYWRDLAEDPQRYSTEKQRIAETVIELLEPRFPGISEQVEVADVATPITTQRFTGNAGGYEYPAGRMMMALLTGRRLSQTLKGLRSFYMVGQYAGPPGVPLVAAMGKDVARAICEQDARPFVAEPSPGGLVRESLA
jgi:phytoene dehydrogenase-like protein